MSQQLKVFIYPLCTASVLAPIDHKIPLWVLFHEGVFPVLDDWGFCVVCSITIEQTYFFFYIVIENSKNLSTIKINVVLQVNKINEIKLYENKFCD